MQPSREVSHYTSLPGDISQPSPSGQVSHKPVPDRQVSQHAQHSSMSNATEAPRSPLSDPGRETSSITTRHIQKQIHPGEVFSRPWRPHSSQSQSSDDIHTPDPSKDMDERHSQAFYSAEEGSEAIQGKDTTDPGLQSLTTLESDPEPLSQPVKKYDKRRTRGIRTEALPQTIQDKALDIINIERAKYWVTQQHKDEFLKALHTYMTEGSLPDDKKMALKIFTVVTHTCLVRNVIFRCDYKKTMHNSEAESLITLWLPSHLVHKYVKMVHDSPTTGVHRAYTTCLQLLRSKFYADKLPSLLYDYCYQCKTCQELRTVRKQVRPLLPMDMTNLGIFDSVAVDIVGELYPSWYNYQENHNSNIKLIQKKRAAGKRVKKLENECLYPPYKWILTYQCSFTKFFAAVPLTSLTSCEIASKMHHHFFTAYKWPQVLLSDRGSNLIGGATRYLYDALGIKHRMTTAFHPSTNGGLESRHKALIRSLSILCKKNHSHWVRFLPAVIQSMNCVATSAHGFAPAALVFGTEIRTPLNMDVPALPPQLKGPLGEELSTIYKSVQGMRQLAKENLLEHQRQYKRQHDKQVKHPDTFVEGDIVMIKISHHKKDPNTCAKFQKQDKFQGFYRVILSVPEKRICKVLDPLTLKSSAFLNFDKIRHAQF